MKRHVTQPSDAVQCLSCGEKTGALCLALALCAAAWRPAAAILPLGVFLLICAVTPFLPCVGFYLPIVCSGPRRGGLVALSFDDGPSPDSTPWILDLLDRHGIRATFFMVGVRARQHPELVREILRRGHAAGNHSMQHDCWLMLRSCERIRRDIHACQETLRCLGARPKLFRPPVGVSGPRLAGALDGEGLIMVNYSRRGLDFGNRRIHGLARRVAGKLRSGDIIMLHDLPPKNAREHEAWLAELDTILGTLARAWTVVPL